LLLCSEAQRTVVILHPMLPMPQKLLNSVQECGVKGVRWGEGEGGRGRGSV